MKWVARWQNVPPGLPATLGSHWGGEDNVSGCQGEAATGTLTAVSVPAGPAATC